MSIGTSSINLALTRNLKRMIVSGGPVWFRNSVSVGVTGFAPATPGNMILLAYRGNTHIATGQGFSGPDSLATGVMDTNTVGMQTVFTGAKEGAIREIDLFLFDSAAPDLLAFGSVDILAVRDYTYVSPLPPISETTPFIGCFAFYQNAAYIRSKDDGLYYLFRGAGSGATANVDVSTVGIVIPGAPPL